MQAFIKQHMGLDKYKIKSSPQDDGKKVQNNPQNNGKPKRIRRTKEQLIKAGYYKDKTLKVEIPKVTTEKLKRHRRTKLEMEQARKQVDTPKSKNKDVDRTHLFIAGSMSVNQMSEKAIEKAKERGDENWEQDFRNDYESGQKIYYVEINELCHTKEVLELYVGTVYSKAMIAWVDRGEAHTIGIEDADKIFRDEKSAKKYYSKVRVKDG